VGFERSGSKAIGFLRSRSISVFIRSIDDMKEVVKEIPKDWQVGSERKYDIIFLGQTIDNPKIVYELEPKPGIEELQYRPGVLFWSVNMRDFAKSNMCKIVGQDMHQEIPHGGPSNISRVHEQLSRYSETYYRN